MSLVRMALRIITVRALTGATVAEDRVGDSVLAPLNVQAKDAPPPSLVVYTDDGTLSVQGLDLLGAAGSSSALSLVIEAVCASRVDLMNDAESVVIPQTDDGFEMLLDLLGRQVAGVLTSGGGVWGDLWRTLVTSVDKVMVRRGGNVEGVRFAARETTLTLDTLQEPSFGEEPSGFWADFLALVEADPELAAIAPMMRLAMTSPDMAGWRVDQGDLGLSANAVRRTGIAPADATETGEPAELVEIDVDYGGGNVMPVLPD